VAPLVALTAAIVFQVVIAGVAASRQLSRGAEPSELPQNLLELFSEPGMFLLFAAGGQLAFAAAALVPARLSHTPARQRLGLLEVRHASIYPLTMLGSLAPLGVGMAAANLLTRILPPDPTAELLFGKITPAWGLLFVLFVATAPAFFEEMLFRGYMQRRLLQRWRPWTAITVTSVTFGLMHIMPHAILVALPLGFWLGAIAWRTGSIGPCIACHAFVNGGVNVWRMVVKFGEVPETAQTIVVLGSLVFGSVCFALACERLARTTARGSAAAARP